MAAAIIRANAITVTMTAPAIITPSTYSQNGTGTTKRGPMTDLPWWSAQPGSHAASPRRPSLPARSFRPVSPPRPRGRSSSRGEPGGQGEVRRDLPVAHLQGGDRRLRRQPERGAAREGEGRPRGGLRRPGRPPRRERRGQDAATTGPGTTGAGRP